MRHPSQEQAAPLASVDEFVAHSYDYVIVGGGTAGLVIAARLTENPDITVGVVEAGSNKLDDHLVNTPALFSQMFGNPNYDWNFKTVPQLGNNGNVHHLVRGKMLGGSSGINFMFYNRGSDADYDDWASLVNDPMWDAQHVRSYMRKSQTLEPIDEALSDLHNAQSIATNHGTNGPIHTSWIHTDLPIEKHTLEAVNELLGLPDGVKDGNNGDRPGSFRALSTVARTGSSKGMRSYSARSFLEPNQTRQNLNVITESLALNIVLEGNIAKGVEFEHSGKQYTVSARKEVLLCAGAIQSPQLLELSGIGDPEVLRKAGVACKIVLPAVGANCQDHLMVHTWHELKEGGISLDVIHDPEFMAGAVKAYEEGKRGPLTSPLGVTGFFPHRTVVSDAELDKTIDSIRATQADPSSSAFYKAQLDKTISRLQDRRGGDLQFILCPTALDWHAAVSDQSKLGIVVEPGKPHSIQLFTALMYPVSRGTVHISTSDPKVQPEIDPAYLKHPADVAVLAAGMKFLDRIANVPQLQDQIARRVLPVPEVDLTNLDNGAAWVQGHCNHEYHVMGTCAMGEVVDTRLKVKGVEGLRVCDASIFPAQVSGNIVGTVYGVAEKASDMIKEDWKSSL